MGRLIRGSPGEISIIAIGPLTNLANAFRADPALPSMVRDITIMGGSLSGGNITPAAEFNAYVDPEAAQIVFHCGVPITMIGLDVTRKVSVTEDVLQKLSSAGNPLGRAAGNWIEIVECLELLRGDRPVASEDLRELSLILSGWMIHLGGQADTPEAGYLRADAAMADGSALTVLMEMIEAQGGDISVFDDRSGFHKPGATRVVEAWETGYVAAMDTTMLGWAVQRLGAGREKAGEPVDPHAGIAFHARRGAYVEKGQPLATLYATREAMLDEPEALLRKAIVFSEAKPEAVPLVSAILTREKAEGYLAKTQG